MDLAERLDRLGTETAFAVSAAAADWAARGNRVYPFHLGDINLPTPANIVDAMNEAIADGKTGYCAAAGIAPLREALAANIGGDRGIELGPANIVVQPGGKPVITKFIQTLMNPATACSTRTRATRSTRARSATSAAGRCRTATTRRRPGSASTSTSCASWRRRRGC